MAVVYGSLMVILGLFALVAGGEMDALVPFLIGALVLGSLVMIRRRRGRDDDADSGPSTAGAGRLRGRVALTFACALLAAMAAGFVAQKLGLSRGGDATALPPVPAAPVSAAEYRGHASDGMQVILWRMGDTVWIRVDSAANEQCGVDWNFAQNSFVTRTPGRFHEEWTFDSTAVTTKPLFGLIGAIRTDVTLPKRVDVETRGKFLPGGRARGAFTRRDVAFDGDEVEFDCIRSVRWTAREV